MCDVQLRWQTWRRCGHRRPVERGLTRVHALPHVVQSMAHTVPRQRVDVDGLGLLQKLGDIAGGNRVALQA